MSVISVELSDHDVQRIAQAVAAQLRQRPSAELLTPAQVAARTGLTPKALERRRSRGQAPHAVRRGGRVFYTAGEVESFIEGTKS